MNWVEEAKNTFKILKPAHFTNFEHCEECSEHDETLINSDVDSIGFNELGNLGWNPLCFSSIEGKKYYMPALIRLSLESMQALFYFEQLLSLLESDGENNSLFMSCTALQRKFIVSFIEYMITNFTNEIELHGCSDQSLRVHEIWSKSNSTQQAKA